MVLIDTWWNVNTNKLGAGVDAVEVLIDTWWNVNNFGYLSKPRSNSVLIDTWWNVNVYVLSVASTSLLAF